MQTSRSAEQHRALRPASGASAQYPRPTPAPGTHVTAGESRAAQLTEATCYHIDLICHDVVLAEGLPVESYLETGARSAFANGSGPVALFPDFHVRVVEAMGCARLTVTGPELDAARMLVSARWTAMASTVAPTGQAA